ncbi:MAG: DUF4827 family protein [Paludibacteraceae bacterium]|nr:DUF4827 family protein [Paludibacteraceae bacterium]
MKKIIYLLLALVTISVASCTTETYADELDEEKSQIKDFLKRNNLRTVGVFPADSVFDEHTFYVSSSGLYFQMTKKGTSTDTVAAYDEVNIRYKKYALKENPDTISTWTTLEQAYPTSFQYLVSSSNACAAWHEAVGYMRYSGSQARLIVPAEIGFPSDQDPLTPYVYEIKIQIKKNS